MKLRNLAALIFRILGASFVLTGLAETTAEIFHYQDMGGIVDALGGLVIGGLTVYYSKKLAQIFCRGLDDDSP